MPWPESPDGQAARSPSRDWEARLGGEGWGWEGEAPAEPVPPSRLTGRFALPNAHPSDVVFGSIFMASCLGQITITLYYMGALTKKCT